MGEPRSLRDLAHLFSPTRVRTQFPLWPETPVRERWEGAVIWVARALALSVLVLAAFTADDGLIMAAGLAFVGLCCLRDS